MADNKHRGSSLDDFLAQEGVLEDFQARAIKEAGNVTIETLQRAAAIVGRRVKIELVEAG